MGFKQHSNIFPLIFTRHPFVIIKNYHYTPKEAISFIKQKRPQALSSLYNYNDLLEDYYKKYCVIQ